MTKKLLFRVPQPVDAVSFYRGFGVLGHLRTIMDLECIHTVEFNWPTLAMFDAVFLVRASTDAERSLVSMVKKNNKPLWIDYDDNVLEVPNSNLTHQFYEQHSIKDNIKYCLEHADVVSVSTEHLAQVFNPYRPLGKPCVVIPNAFPSHYIDLNRKPVPRKKIITWRGSRTHDKDLFIARDLFAKVIIDYPEWNFVFLGEPDWRTLDMLPKNRYRVINSTGILEYMETFFNIGATAHVVPLEDGAFNRSKSNIAWLEATYAGAAVFAPAMPEWKRPGIESLENLWSYLDGGNQFQPMVDVSREYIQNYLMIDKVNLLRRQLLESIL
jgi:hypothetical protein